MGDFGGLLGQIVVKNDGFLARKAVEKALFSVQTGDFWFESDNMS
jgi:hypothetical protein